MAGLYRGERMSILDPSHLPHTLRPYDPCDEKRPFTSFDSPWPRHPTDKPLPNRAVDEEELASAFAEMRIGDPSMSARAPKAPHSGSRFCHCGSPTTPPSAPLPALLNCRVSSVKVPTIRRRRCASIQSWGDCHVKTTSNGSTAKVVVGVSRAAVHPYNPHRSDRIATTRSPSASSTSTSRSHRSVSGSSSDGSSLCTPPSTPAKSATFIFYKPHRTSATSSPELHSP